MKLEDFCDMKKFEEIMSNWALSTGLATELLELMDNISATAIILQIFALS